MAFKARLSRTLGRLVGRPWRVEIGAPALVSSTKLREVVTHEGAHAAVATRGGARGQAPQGPNGDVIPGRGNYLTGK